MCRISGYIHADKAHASSFGSATDSLAGCFGNGDVIIDDSNDQASYPQPWKGQHNLR